MSHAVWTFASRTALIMYSVILASKRGIEIAEGQPKLVAVNPNTKPSTIALYEIAQGKVHSKKSKPEK